VLAALRELRHAEPESFGAMFLDRVARTPAVEAYRRLDDRGAWRSQTWAETGTAVTEIAAGLLDLGLRPQERVAILAGTRTEWIEADFGVMCAGGATTTVYPTGSPAEVAHILGDSASRFAVVEQAGQLGKVLTAVARAFSTTATSALISSEYSNCATIVGGDLIFANGFD
jgi:long-chain acyl-CoA synthetase